MVGLDDSSLQVESESKSRVGLRVGGHLELSLHASLGKCCHWPCRDDSVVSVVVGVNWVINMSIVQKRAEGELNDEDDEQEQREDGESNYIPTLDHLCASVCLL